MVLRNRVIIRERPEKIWEFIRNPSLMKTWNGRIRVVVPVSLGDVAEGFRFRVRYILDPGESNVLAEVIEYESQRLLAIHFSGGNLPKKGYALERYELSEGRKGTVVRQTLEISRAGGSRLGRLVRAIPWYVTAWGGRRHLARLKELSESGESRQEG